MTVGSRVSCRRKEVSNAAVCHAEDLSMKFPVGAGCRKILRNGVIRIKKSVSLFGLIMVFLGGVFCVTFLVGCASRQGGTAILLQRGVHLEKLAVVPFQVVVPGDPVERIVRCPLSGATFRSCVPSGNPERKLEEYLVGGLKPSGGCVVIPPREMQGAYQRVSADSMDRSPREVLRAVGKEVGADGVLAGYLFCYRERRGRDYAAERPASVAFCVHLIRVADGVTIWKGVFDKTQGSLMENILDIIPFIRGGGRWMTADELSREGMRVILGKFPEMEGRDK